MSRLLHTKLVLQATVFSLTGLLTSPFYLIAYLHSKPSLDILTWETVSTFHLAELGRVVNGWSSGIAKESIGYEDTIWELPIKAAGAGPWPVALTVDDVPGDDPESFFKLLDLMDELEVRATFFVTSKFIGRRNRKKKRQVEAIQAAVDRGHEIGNHLHTLGTAWKWDAEKLNQHMDMWYSNMSQIRNPNEVRWFRAPTGLHSRTMQTICKERGLRHVLGSVWGNDVIIQNNPEFHTHYYGKRARPGSIFIFHGPDGTRDRLQILDWLPMIHARLQSKGLYLTTLSDTETASQGQRDVRSHETSVIPNRSGMTEGTFMPSERLSDM